MQISKLKVLHTSQGYYLGTVYTESNAIASIESGYYDTKKDAERALYIKKYAKLLDPDEILESDSEAPIPDNIAQHISLEPDLEGFLNHEDLQDTMDQIDIAFNAEEAETNKHVFKTKAEAAIIEIIDLLSCDAYLKDLKAARALLRKLRDDVLAF